MEKYTLLFLLFLLSTGDSSAQKTDFDWMFGWELYPDPLDSIHGTSHLNFNTEPPSVYFEHTGFNFDISVISACNDEGGLQFYSNGFEIRNVEHDTLMFSENFNDYDFHEGWEDTGMPLVQGVLSLPVPEDEGVYCVLHTKFDYLELDITDDVGGVGLYYTIIDMNNDSGLGEVIEKDIPIIEDTLCRGGIIATKHANGRDWWIVVPAYNSNEYYRVLINSDGPNLLANQVVGIATKNGLGQACFSPDGNWYARNTILGTAVEDDYLDLYRFDRCTGLLSNHIRFSYGNGVGSGGGTAFSPNSRFLYLGHRNHVFQYDMEAGDIESSRDTVAIYDGYLDNGWNPTTLFLAQLAPDGKIYMNTAPGSTKLHTIHQPNLKGMSCAFEQRAVELPAPNSYSLPNFPNYRLGPIDGSSCDTLGLNNDPVAKFRYDQDSLNLGAFSFTDISYYNPETWSWSFGDGNMSTDTNPSHNYETSGIYDVCLTVSNTNGNDTVCRSIVILSPVAAFSCVTDTLNELNFYFEDESYYNPDSWLWEFGDGNNSSADSSVVHTFSGNGSYEICLTVENELGQDSMCKEIVIAVSGLESIKENEVITMYPNPTDGSLLLHSSLVPFSMGKLSIYTLNGILVHEEEFRRSVSEFELGELPNGLYLVYVFEGQLIRYCQKLVVLK